MMAKITQGSGFRGVVNYVMDKPDARLIGAEETIRLRDKNSIIESFMMQAGQKPSVKKPVEHISLDFSVQDKGRLSDAAMVTIAWAYLEAMGYKNTQYIMVRHHDREHPHLHIVLNRIDNDGNRISDHNEKYRSTKVCMELTKKYGLYIADGKERVKRHRLKEPEKSKYAIYDALQAAIPECKNWDELQAALWRQGITIDFQHNGSTDKIQGVRFGKNGYTFNGSKIDRSCSYSKIDWQLRHNEYEQRNTVHQERQQPYQQHSKQSSTAESLTSSIGGLFDMPTTGTNDAEEQADYWLYRKKKKKTNKGIRL
jgi:hypothetical protein